VFARVVGLSATCRAHSQLGVEGKRVIRYARKALVAGAIPVLLSSAERIEVARFAVVVPARSRKGRKPDEMLLAPVLAIRAVGKVTRGMVGSQRRRWIALRAVPGARRFRARSSRTRLGRGRRRGQGALRPEIAFAWAFDGDWTVWRSIRAGDTGAGPAGAGARIDELDAQAYALTASARSHSQLVSVRLLALCKPGTVPVCCDGPWAGRDVRTWARRSGAGG